MPKGKILGITDGDGSPGDLMIAVPLRRVIIMLFIRRLVKKIIRKQKKTKKGAMKDQMK